MVLVLLMFLFLAVVTVGLWAYSRSLLTSAAAQAARYAANADVQDPAAASERAAQIMSHTAAGSTAGTVRCTPGPPGALMIEVHCSMRSPGILPLLSGIMPDISVTAHTLREHP